MWRSLSTPSLRGLYATLEILDVLPMKRAAIAHELAVRAWAEACERQIENTIGWCRGGRS